MARSERDPAREARWRKLVARQRKSGLSVREFCRHERLSEPSFYGWRREIERRDQESAEHGRRPAFVPVTVGPPEVANVADGTGQIIIELRGGRVLRLPLTMPAAQAAEWVRAVEAVETRS